MPVHYINGQWVEAEKATLSVNDRGHQFGDGVYEVIAYYNRAMVDFPLHLKRLENSLRAIRITNPHDASGWEAILQQLIDRNGAEHGNLYLQITRGVAARDHRFPADTPPSVTAHHFAPKTPAEETVRKEGMRAITQPDIRWKRCDIKSTNLLANVLAKQAAAEAGAQDALLVKDNGEISEASVSNAFAVMDDVLITHPLTNEILPGITRHHVLRLARDMGLAVQERPFSLSELQGKGQELFLTNTTSNLMPITLLDGQAVGNGKPGPVTLKLLDAYLAFIAQETGHHLYGS